MPPTALRPHSPDPDVYSWETIADGEEAGTERAAIRASRGCAEPRDIVAGLYGCEDWDRFEARLRGLASDDPFVAGWNAVGSGDRDALARAVDADPSVVPARGPEGATLLDYAIWKTCQGDLSWPPSSADAAAERLELAELLLDAGADVEQGNLDGWVPLHTAAYIGWLPTIELLLGRGARIDRSTKGDGGTPLVFALFWGHREAAERLARKGIVPLNMRVATGLGRRDLLAHAGDGHRGFYRPHSDFKEWRPSDDPQEIRDEALLWACRNGRVEVLDHVGGDVNAEVAGTTPLLSAAGNGWSDCVRWLLDHGADLERTASQWREATALHVAAWFDHLETVKLLVSRGARCDVREPEYNGTPYSWASFHGNVGIARWLAENAQLDAVDAAESLREAPRSRMS